MRAADNATWNSGTDSAEPLLFAIFSYWKQYYQLTANDNCYIIVDIDIDNHIWKCYRKITFIICRWHSKCEQRSHLDRS